MHSAPSVSLRPGGGKGRPSVPTVGSHGTSSPDSLLPTQTRDITRGAGWTSPTESTLLINCTEGALSKDPRSLSWRIRYTSEELHKLKEVSRLQVSGEVLEEIKNAVLEINSELSVPDEPGWVRPTSNGSIHAQGVASASRFSQVNNRDWKARAFASEDRQVKETGKLSDNDWRVKDQGRDNPAVQLVPRPQEPHLFRPQEPPYPRHPEPPYPRNLEPLYSSHQEPTYPREWELLYPKQHHLQYSRQQEPLTWGVDASREAATMSRAANPWMARRGVVSEKEKVLRTVKGILNKLTPEKFNVLVEQLLHAGINSAEILKGVISLVFDKAVLEPTFCPMYAEMCVHLSKALPEFPSDEEDGKPVTFRRVLLNSCQEEFEGADNIRAEIRQLTRLEQEVERLEKEKLLKLRTLGNIRLIGELFKQRMIPEKIVHYCIQMLLGSDPKTPPAEESIEALCKLLATVGKQLEASNKCSPALESYFSQLKEYSSSSCLPARIRFLILNTIDLRANKWVPRREEVKAKTLNEIHAEAQKTLGLRPGVTGMRNGWGAQGVIGFPGGMANNFAYMRPSGMMPGMPGLLPIAGMMPGMAPLLPNFIPGADSDGWQYAAARKNKMGQEGLMPPPTALQGGPYGILMPGVRPSIPNTNFLPQVSSRPYMGRPSGILGDAIPKAGQPFMTVPFHGYLNQPQRNPVGMMERVEAPPKPMTLPPTLPAGVLEQRSESLLKEYLHVGDLKEALLCVEELGCHKFYPQLVQHAIMMAMDGKDRERELVIKLVEDLYFKNVITVGDVRAGILMVVEQLEDIAIDIPLAPIHVGEFVGKMALAGIVELELLIDVLRKSEDPLLKRSVYDATVMTVRSSWNRERILGQNLVLQECERVIGIARR